MMPFGQFILEIPIELGGQYPQNSRHTMLINCKYTDKSCILWQTYALTKKRSCIRFLIILVSKCKPEMSKEHDAPPSK